ncbi:MAG: hypothetical protein AAGK00_09110 [Pseudomonadota bacterium]
MSLGTTVWADDNRFTAADVLGWEPSQKDWYFEVATGMATVVASRSRSPAARCINDWYFANDSLRAARNNEMRALLRRYRDYHPSNVIAAVIEKECGPIGATQ